MKNLILIFALLFSTLTLFSKETIIKYYLNNGTPKQYRIKDLTDIDLIKSNKNNCLYVYYNKKSSDKIKTTDIDKVELSSNNFKIYTSTKIFKYTVENIDSIIIKKIIPQIAYIHPIAIKTGDIISIIGSDFNEIKGTNFVTFLGIKATEYILWSDTLVKVMAPYGIISGDLAIFAKGEKSNSIEYVLTDVETVSIGTQLWMLKNLDVTTYRNGDPIPEVRDSAEWVNLKTGAWCYLNNDPINGTKYGKLYNWYAVSDPRGLAPAGWHVPSNSDWNILVKYLGGNALAGSKLKEKGTAHWSAPNSDATNESGFNALPGGYRKYPIATFPKITDQTCFWTSSPITNSSGYSYSIWHNSGNLNVSGQHFKSGFSVRCIWGTLEGNPIITKVSPATGVTGDEISIFGSGFGDKKGTNLVIVCDGIVSNYISWKDDLIKVQVPPDLFSGKVAVYANGYKSNEIDFKIRLYLFSISPKTSKSYEEIMIMGSGFENTRDSSYVLFCDKKAFKYNLWSQTTILAVVPNINIENIKLSVFVNNKQSNEVDFKTILRDSLKEIWSKKNLDVAHYRNGDSIPQVTDLEQLKTITTGAWCYPNNDSRNDSLYGKLYNWYAVNDSRGLAPEGWHVATDEEWNKLVESQGGEGAAGISLKSKGTIEDGTGLWFRPNEGAADEIGFSAVPAGANNGNFGIAGNWWTSNENGSTSAWWHSMSNDGIYVYKFSGLKTNTYSVRCVKD